MHGCAMENVQKIKIKMENIWIDLIRSIYAPYKSFRETTPVSSTCQCVPLLGCHGVGTQSVGGGPFHLECRSCHKSGERHQTLTTPPSAPTLSGCSTTPPLPSPWSLPSLCHRTPFGCLTALLPWLNGCHSFEGVDCKEAWEEHGHVHVISTSASVVHTVG